MEQFLSEKKRKYGQIDLETEDQGATCNLCFMQEDQNWDDKK